MFRRIRGNARGCLVYEPMWILPASLFMTYSSVYMLQLGLSEEQIGFITSFGLVLQIFSSAVSGQLTDRMGRRKALILFDVISWTGGTLLWAISQNFWYFVVAAIFNSFQKVPNTAWYCLLVEDTPPEDRTVIFTVIQFIGVVGGLIAPVGGLMVNHWHLVPAVRMMYGIAFVSMTIMFIGRHFATHETEIGLRKIQESKHVHYRDDFADYFHLIKEVLTNKALLLIFAVYVLNNFQMTLKSTYQSIYLVNALHISDALIAIFPAVSSAAMLLLMWLVVPRFQERHAFIWMVVGFGISLLANILLILIPIGSITGVIVSTVLTAAGTILANPFLESVVANTIDDEHRAKILAVLTVLILVFTSPAGVIGGWTYTIDPRIPFVLVIVTFAFAMLFTGWFRKHQAPTQADLTQATQGA